MEIVGAALGVIGVLLALAVPAYVEWARRPSLRVDIGSDANSEDPLWRIVHIRVINEPIAGRLGRILLRNPAAGCEVTMEFASRSDGASLKARGKWSAKPQPLALIPVGDGNFGWLFDAERIPETLTLDVSPGEEGQPVAVAIKHNNDPQAYAFDPDIYAHGNLRRDALALPHEAYNVTVTARAGGIESEPRRFRLHNAGTAWRDLRLESPD